MRSLQISRTGNIIQGYKRSYRNGKQPIDEMIAIRRGKKQKPSNCYNDSDVGHGNDNNPFIAQTGGVQQNISHAIDNVVINNVFKNDWIIPDGYNISTDFCKLQVESIEKLKTDLILLYAKEIDMILCLSSIMYCNELKPEYVKYSEKIWKELIRDY
ncbi:unnamed protein product [Rhizophagus irregularis]|nr:unnamed protein product [Rhizophagus irregularis]CAB4400951.1 unnamed protein product [Rhizophagus irregularis]